MAEDVKAVKLSAYVEDGVVHLSASVDVIDALEDMVLKTDNSIDDALVKIVKAAKDNLDWKGVAKELV